MTLLRTDLGNLKESARRERFEPTGSISETNVQKAIEQVASQPPVLAQTNITAAMSPYTVLATDVFLAVDPSGGAVRIDMQPNLDRDGVGLTIKDVTGHAATNAISIYGNGSELIDTLSPYPINSDFGGVYLVPITGGYTVSP